MRWLASLCCLALPYVDLFCFVCLNQQVVNDHRQQYFDLTWRPLIDNLVKHVDDMNLASQQKKNNALKERFRAFNKAFSDINATQCQWTVTDVGLKSAVKQSIVAEVVPAYGVFCGVMETTNFTKNKTKYFKYVFPGGLLKETFLSSCVTF